MPLMTYADLIAPSKSDATKSNAVISLARMKSAASPMPALPAAPASAAEISAFEAWVSLDDAIACARGHLRRVHG